jgi:hypothetical protein
VTTFFNQSFGLILVSAILLTLVYILVSWSAGSLVLRKSPTLKGPAASFVLGHAVLALLIQLITVGGFLYWYILLPLFAAILCLNLSKSSFPRFGWKLKDWFPEYRPNLFLVFGLALLVVIFAAAALSYPGTDALAYYLAQPKLMAATGRYTLLPAYENFSVLPAIAEMPYATMYAFGGEAVGLVAAKLSVWPVFLACLSLLWQCARGVGLSVDAAWFFVAVGATSTAVTLTAWDGKTDLVGLMYALGAVLWIPGLISSKPDQGQFWLFGFMSACAVMAKLSYALVLPFCLGIPLLCLWWKQRAMILRILVPAGLAACLTFALGWWVKNYFLFGDPLAPILMLHESTPRFNLEQAWFNADNTRWILTTYPLAVTFGLYPMQHGGISPLWLMLIPALWMRPWQSEAGRKALYLGLGGVAGTLAWALLRPSVIAPRYFLPPLIFPCLILIAGYDRWLSERRTWAAAALLSALVLVTLHVAYVSNVCRFMTRPFVSALKGGHGATPAMDRAKRLASDLRPNVKVLLLSYSSEFLPNRMLASFLTIGAIEKNKNALEWALREKVDYIVYDPITHKRGDLDVPPPPGLLVEKLDFAPNVYYLYVLTRTGEAR